MTNTETNTENAAQLLYEHSWDAEHERCECGADTDGDTAKHQAEVLATAGLLISKVDPQPEGQDPVSGYTQQSEFNVRSVNAIKDVENDVGELVEVIANDVPGVDPRMVALARTNLQQGFMWLVRAVFQPESRL